MKPFNFAVIAAALIGNTSAQTATSVPAGYITISVPANSDTTITPSLTRSQLFSAAATGISADTVSVTGISAGAFASPNEACYLKVTSGALAGAFFPITANTSSTITVDAGDSTLQQLGFLNGNSIKVIPYWTLNTLFPDGAGVGGTSDALAPSSFVLESDYAGTGVNRASGKVFFYCTGDAENNLSAGWYNNSDPFAGTVNNTPIDPSIQYIIRSVAAASVIVAGQVPVTGAVTEIVTAVSQNDNYVAAPFPIDVSLQESGLQSVIASTSDVLAPTEYVFVYDDAASGINKAAGSAYFYCSGDSENSLPAGWYNNADPFAGAVTTKVLKAGRAFVLRKAPSASAVLDWVSPLPYTL